MHVVENIMLYNMSSRMVYRDNYYYAYKISFSMYIHTHIFEKIKNQKWQRTLTAKGNSVVDVLLVPATAMMEDRRRRGVLPVDTRQGNTRISAPVLP